MCSWFMETHKERSSPKSWGDWWPEGIGAEGNGRSVGLSAAVGSDALPVWSLIEAHFKLAPILSQAWGVDSSELPDDPLSSMTWFLKAIASWSCVDAAEVEGRRKRLNELLIRSTWRVSWGISSVQWWLSGEVSIKSEEDGGVPTRLLVSLCDERRSC